VANSDTNKAPAFTNPLQNNNAALAIVGYVAGIVAVKFPIFDLATWNYIFMSIGGLVFFGGSYILNRKSNVVATVANMAEVKSVELDKTVTGAKALEDITPNNVTVAK
jgi:hypothetical protein